MKEKGEAREPTRMVDVAEKPVTERQAVAKGMVKMKPATLSQLKQGKMAKGDVLAVAQVAGIMAAKQTSQIIPLCHPLPIDEVKVEFRFHEEGVEITARVKSTGKTGVEMEALTAVAAAALTIYDMCKAVERGIIIEGIRLVKKSGGRSGTIVLE
jgi:cyclic pyranopterin phosphate synthase